MSTSEPTTNSDPRATVGRAAHAQRLTRTLRAPLTAVAIVGLAIDAYVHLDLAGNYDAIKTSTLSQGDLFRAEAGAAILAAVALLIHPRRYTTLFAVLVAAGGLAAVLTYRYYNIPGFGPFPAMYEPVWYTEKTQSAYAEAAATVASAALLVTLQVYTRRRQTHTNGVPEELTRPASPPSKRSADDAMYNE